jgi:hypothetical protein
MIQQWFYLTDGDLYSETHSLLSALAGRKTTRGMEMGKNAGDCDH